MVEIVEVRPLGDGRYEVTERSYRMGYKSLCTIDGYVTTVPTSMEAHDRTYITEDPPLNIQEWLKDTPT